MAADDIWKLLIDNNRRFAKGELNPISVPAESIQLRDGLAVKGQKPLAAILTCADSRVPPESIFQTKLGDLFVVRVAGNLASTEVVGSLEFAVKNLKVKLLVILGHSKCGAVMGALNLSTNNKSDDTSLGYLIKQIAENLDKKNDLDLDAAIKANVAKNAEMLLRRSEYLRSMNASNSISLVTAVYDIHSGQVSEV